MTAPSYPKALAERLRVPSNSRSFADDAAMREAADALEEVKRERDEARRLEANCREEIRALRDEKSAVSRDLAAAREAVVKQWDEAISVIEAQEGMHGWKARILAAFRAKRSRAALSPATKEME